MHNIIVKFEDKLQVGLKKPSQKVCKSIKILKFEGFQFEVV